jgi:hypothetical protein
MERSPYPGTPRWVKVTGIIALLVLALLAHRLIRGGRGHAHDGQQLPAQSTP